MSAPLVWPGLSMVHGSPADSGDRGGAVTPLGHRSPSPFGIPPLVLWLAVTASLDPLEAGGHSVA